MSGYEKPHRHAVTIALLPVELHVLLMDELLKTSNAHDAIGLWERADQLKELRAEIDTRSVVVPVIGQAVHTLDCLAYRKVYKERHGIPLGAKKCICFDDRETTIRELCNALESVHTEPSGSAPQGS